MKKNVIKFFGLILVFALYMAGSVLLSVSAEEQGTDDFLRATGMPQAVIDSLTEERKEFIRENLDVNATFSSYDVKKFNVTDEGEMEALSAIADSDLTLSVVAYKCVLSGVGDAYAIFPSFVWNKDVKIKNDSFAFALYPNWEILATEDYNLRVWIKNIYGDKVQSTDVAANRLTYNGQSYKMSDIGFMQGLYEGNAVFYAKKTSSTATQSIVLEYIHDKSSGCDISYSVSIDGISISISPSSSNLDVKTDYFTYGN